MAKMIWMDPPKVLVGRPVKFSHEAKTLKANPNRWAKISGKHNPKIANGIKNGKLKAFSPAGAFEAVNRDVVNNRGDLYVRYVGASDQ